MPLTPKHLISARPQPCYAAASNADACSLMGPSRRAQPSEDRHRFPFFSEENNPLYAPQAEPGTGGSSGESSGASGKRARREPPTEDMIFHTIRSVFECARIPSECLIVSLVYIERLIAVSGCPMLVTSWRPILLSALILAQKVWDDRSLHNVDFSVFCPMFTLKEINVRKPTPTGSRMHAPTPAPRRPRRRAAPVLVPLCSSRRVSLRPELLISPPK